jgi:prevent-host-death family protein
MEVSIHELKNHLSEYLRQVQAGVDLVITSRGRPVARLTPIVQTPEENEAAVIERIKSLPWVISGKSDKPRRLHPPIDLPEGVSLSDAVLEERR